MQASFKPGVRGFFTCVVLYSMFSSCYGMKADLVKRQINFSEERQQSPDYADEKLRFDLENNFLKAAMWCDISKMEKMLASGANINALVNDSRKTSLHIAVEKNKGGVVDWLLGNGVDPSLRDFHGDRPIDIAWKNGFFHIVLKIVMHNDGVQTVNDRWIGKSFFDYTCYRFVLNGDVKGLDSFFAECGTQVGLDSFIPGFPLTLLILACQLGNLDVVKSLVLHGAGCLIPECPRDCLPLAVAVRFGHEKIVEYLLQVFPALKEDKGELGETPLRLALVLGRFELAALMLSLGVYFDMYSQDYCSHVLESDECDDDGNVLYDDEAKLFVATLMNTYLPVS